MSTALGAKQKELNDLETLRFVTGALFEVSAESIGRLRIAFEKNRLFYVEISELYDSIKQTALSRGHIAEKKSAHMRGVSVAFTTNSRFYGSVNSDVMRVFVEHMRVTKRDCVVIGKTGHSFLENHPQYKRRCSELLFTDDQPTEKEMRQFLKKVSAYDQVHVFHPSFVNIFMQEASVLDITHTPQRESSSTKENEIDYIFEPELKKILHFFETRVRYLLFQRVMLEAELARTAARLLAMNTAEERASDAVLKMKKQIRREMESFNDMQLLESFSSIKKWKE